MSGFGSFFQCSVSHLALPLWRSTMQGRSSRATRDTFPPLANPYLGNRIFGCYCLRVVCLQLRWGIAGSIYFCHECCLVVRKLILWICIKQMEGGAAWGVLCTSHLESRSECIFRSILFPSLSSWPFPNSFSQTTIPAPLSLLALGSRAFPLEVPPLLFFLAEVKAASFVAMAGLVPDTFGSG